MQNKENKDNTRIDMLHEPIAIIGMGCQFPGVTADIEDVDAFYEMLLKKQTPIKEVPESRWDINKYYDPDRQKEDKIVSRKGGFLEDYQLFDAAFFKIPPIEAKQIDPQHRLFLEVSVRALNQANITLQSLKNSNTGVYCGISTQDYNQLNFKENIKFNAYTYIGSANSAAAGRLSYFLHLKGPCITVDTACSSSLSALYLATMALRNQQCNMAFVGGVHLSLCPEICIGLTKANMLSTLGQCSSFDAKADGYVRSEGCGVLLIKRLSDAVKDNNTIHAVINSIAINQDGGGMGMAAPNLEAQIAMHEAVLKEADLEAQDIDYIETHGTGTVVGDSVEFNAIKHIHQGQHSKDKPLIIGALKSNLGHTISSSGIASLIKVIQALKQESIPANLHYSTPNSTIDPDSIPALIPVKTTTFTKEPNKKRYAQVSNFGFTGTNVSLIVEEPPISVSHESIENNNKPLCFVISANSEYSLKQMLMNYANYLKKSPINLHDVCYTLINCRDHYKFRCAIMAQDKESLIKKIEEQNYLLKKVTLEEDIKIIGSDAKQIYEDFLSGANIRSDTIQVQYKQVDLPLYFFDRKTYWRDATVKSIETQIPKDWCFELDWIHQAFNKNNFKKTGTKWLLIGSKQLAFSLTQQGLSIVLEEDNPSFNDLNGIIFAEGICSPSIKEVEEHIDLQKSILKKLLASIKNLNNKAIKLQLIILTHNAIAELAEEKINLESSFFPGFCKTLFLELPQYESILIDLDQINGSNCTAQIMNEINYNHGELYEHVIAYRNGRRLLPRLKKSTLGNKKISLRHDGRYLITGGCGGLGLVTAQALLSVGAGELILVSRVTDKPLINAQIKKIQALYPDRIIRRVNLDITDKKRVSQLLLESNADGLLKGIIHAAGASVNASLLEHHNEDIDYLFSAKVQGGWYLHELTKNFNLDFFVVYSSVSSLFGSNKESIYSATNSFLDALISERRSLGLVGTAIQWGPWAEVGMAEKRSQVHGLKQAFIHKEQGLDLIPLLINAQSTHTNIISPEYLKFMLDFVPKPMPGFYKSLTEDLNVIEQLPNSNNLSWLSDYSKTDDNKKFVLCKTLISNICKLILGVPETEQIDEEEGFFSIGLDSLMMAEMAARLKEKLKPLIPVAATIAFDYPSINKLSRHIESELKNHIINSQPSPSAVQVDDPIAIIGMSCSLPNAPNITAFEQLLENGLSGIKDIPIDRWDNKHYYNSDPDVQGKSYVTQFGSIENIKSFDPHFFGISPREAPFVEPQQRLFLENCYKALEHANYPAQSLRGSLTGVFAGVSSTHEYYAQLEKSGLTIDEQNMFSITGKSLNIIPGRVAFTFDFKGPALSIDTACSSSLVAIHYACQSLKNREIDFALAGGVNVLLRAEGFINLCKAKALSPVSQCKTFDENADGYVRSEGCGVLFLKRLSDAVRDKDTILAVIKGSAINNDGKSAGLTVPNGKSQEEVMLKALNQTKISSSDIGYIEAHGTGTPLGDPIEVHAINKVYGTQRRNDNPLYIGTVKTNIGHLESASGVAGIIKVVLSLQKKRIYKNLNFQRLNSNIDIGATQIALDNVDWSSNTRPNIAAVNAFGFSGTNAHAILEEFPNATIRKITLSPQINLLVLSAKTQIALDNLAKRYQEFLATTSYDFKDICFTAATCRDHHAFRLAVAAKSAIEASELLKNGEFNSIEKNNTALDLHNNTHLKLLYADYIQNKAVDWIAYYNEHNPQSVKVALPHYSFVRSEFWLEKRREDQASETIWHPLLGTMLSMPNNEFLFHHQLNVSDLNYINQYVIFGKMIFPAAAYIESGLAAAKSILKCQAFCIKEFHIVQPFFLQQIQEIQVQVKPKDDAQYAFNFYGKTGDKWQNFSQMELHPIPLLSETIDLLILKKSYDNQVDIAQFYQDRNKGPLFHAPERQVLQEGYLASDSVLSKVVLTKTNSEQSYCYHPLVLESVMHSLFLLLKHDEPNTTYLPYSFARMSVFQDAPRTVWIHVIKCTIENENEVCADVLLYDHSGLLIGSIEELRLRKVTQSHFVSYESALSHLYDIQWSSIDLNLAKSTTVPDLWVISKDEAKAKKILGNRCYQLIDNVSKLEIIKDKHIVFLYEEQQFNELFHCCQRFFKSTPASFILVTENAYAINDNGLDTVNPYHTMASSFWKSFRNELELNKNFMIDLNSSSTLETILSHLFNTISDDTQFMIRDAIYVPRLKKKKLPIQHVPQKKLFEQDASYLITGGTGGLAKPLIQYLIGRGVNHIIITSRSECQKDTKALIEEARKNQVCIKHYSVDASNFEQMKHLIELIEQSSKPLKGIFHLAGVIHNELIANLGDKAMQHVLRAKMDSALLLHQLTKEIPLDLFVLFSSVASILGSRRQSNYVAANGFLDGLAHLRQQLGLPALAINWGPFETIGMAAQKIHSLQQRGFIALSENNIDILDVLLPTKLAQIVLCPIDWDTYFKSTPKQIELYEHVKNTPPADLRFLDFLEQHSEKERVTLLTEALCEIAADVLRLNHMEEIGPKTNLFTMGMDSLTSLELRNRIHDKLHNSSISLPIEYFINEPRIDKIAKNIAQDLNRIFEYLHHNVDTEKETDAGITLCDTQYIFWMIEKLRFNFNCAMQLQLHGELNVEFLYQAFNFTISQNDVFWLNFNSNAPIQTLKRQGELKFCYEDIASNYDPISLTNAFYYDLYEHIPLTEQPLIRIFLYKLSYNLHELHIFIPHIIVDEISCKMFFAQFKENYHLLLQGKTLISEPEKHTYLDYVKQHNVYYETDLKNKIDFWRVYNKDVPMLSFGQDHHLADAANQETNLFHYTLDAELINKFKDWHKKRNINVSTGLIAACQIAFYKFSHQKKVSLTILHSGREGSRFKSVMGLFTEYKRINSTLNEQNTFIDLLKSIENELLKTAPYQKCSQLIKSIGLKNSRLSIGSYLTYLYNKFSLSKHFNKTNLNPITIDFYLKRLSILIWRRTKIKITAKVNELFKLDIPLLKPDQLRVIINISVTFFIKEPRNVDLPGIKTTTPNHYGSVDRPIGNQSLWVYFTKDQYDKYQLSINGPLTMECKNQIAQELNYIMNKIVQNEEETISTLLHNR